MVPEQRPIIADAGPLIALSRIGRLVLLEQVFGEVWITETVRDELLGSGNFPGQEEITTALAGWLHSVPVDMSGWCTNNPDIDPGEASSICLAENHPNSLLVIDDKAGRLEAQDRGLHFMGLAGVVRLAKQAGLFAAAKPILQSLQKAGYFIDKSVMHKILLSIGEC